jgi:hypothetical protein
MMMKRMSGSGVQGSVICSGMPVDKVAVRLFGWAPWRLRLELGFRRLPMVVKGLVEFESGQLRKVPAPECRCRGV